MNMREEATPATSRVPNTLQIMGNGQHIVGIINQQLSETFKESKSYFSTIIIKHYVSSSLDGK